jgi:hypothetical protein
MDSGGSGSMQSSSGGEEEYDSSAPPAFFNNLPTHFGSISSNPRPSFFYQHQNHHQSNLFDLSPNYLHAFSQTQANSADLANLPAASLNKLSSSSSAAPPEPNQGSMHNGVRPTTQRNSKKRTRATRRAPTTVLTTDTTNFRAMVQEFTGIPSPPFSGGSPYSRRLDLFGSGSSFRSGGHLEAVGGSSAALYPLRPSAQKLLQPSPFVVSSSSSSSSSLLNNTMSMVDATNVGNSTTLNNYHQLPSNLGGLPRQPQNILLNMQNPILTFQSSLPQPNIPGFGAPSPGSLALPSLEELGMSHGHANLNLGGGGGGLPNHRAGSNGPGRSSQEHLRPLDGNYGNSPRVGGCKLNYSASSSSDFNVHDKSLENNVSGSRADGTVDSWLCHSG